MCGMTNDNASPEDLEVIVLPDDLQVFDVDDDLGGPTKADMTEPHVSGGPL